VIFNQEKAVTMKPQQRSAPQSARSTAQVEANDIISDLSSSVRIITLTVNVNAGRNAAVEKDQRQRFYRAMHYVYCKARSCDRMSSVSVRLSVCLSVCDVGEL